jgi:hypothetical protein
MGYIVSRDSPQFGYRQSWKHYLKIYLEAWGKNTVYRFRTLFKYLPFKNTKMLPLKTTKVCSVYRASDPPPPPPSRHLDKLKRWCTTTFAVAVFSTCLHNMESRLRDQKLNYFQGEHCPGHQTIVTHILLSFSSSPPKKKSSRRYWLQLFLILYSSLLRSLFITRADKILQMTIPYFFQAYLV